MNNNEKLMQRFEELSNEVLRCYAALNYLSPLKLLIDQNLDDAAAAHVIAMIEKAERFNP